jgi:hypothetical protein
VRRALELLGLGSGAMREVPLDGGRLDAAALRASIAADRASGAVPVLLVGSAGTVNAGVIDPLEALADVASAEGLWFHVDGAYGAFGVLDPAISARYRGMEHADSLVLDPHKWLGVPVDAGCALVRRSDDLRDAFSLIPPYLRQNAGAPVGTFAEYGLEQTRPFRDAGRARARAGAGRRARDLHRRLPRAPGGLSAVPAGRRQPRTAGGGSGARARLRHRYRLRRPRDAARLHPPPGDRLGAPRDPRRGGSRDGPHAGRRVAIRARQERAAAPSYSSWRRARNSSTRPFGVRSSSW